MSELVHDPWGIGNCLHRCWTAAGYHLHAGNTECNMAPVQRIVLNFPSGLQQQIWLNMPIRRLREMAARNHRFTSCSTMTRHSVAASQASPLILQW